MTQSYVRLRATAPYIRLQVDEGDEKHIHLSPKRQNGMLFTSDGYLWIGDSGKSRKYGLREKDSRAEGQTHQETLSAFPHALMHYHVWRAAYTIKNKAGYTGQDGAPGVINS